MINAFSVTDIGRRRQLNQDFVFTSVFRVGALPNLFVVADGMGGHKAGDYASRCGVETIVEEIVKTSSGEPGDILRQAISKANERIRIKASEDENMVGMGTTCVAATVKDNVLVVANVGDSRLYLINKQIKQVTRDHSLVEEMIRMGGLDRVSARNHPDKNIITRALGAEDSVIPDFFEIEVEEGDIVLMCSDGLTNMVEDDEILRIVNSDATLESKAQTLIDRANENGGKDNIAVLLFEPYEK